MPRRSSEELRQLLPKYVGWHFEKAATDLGYSPKSLRIRLNELGGPYDICDNIITGPPTKSLKSALHWNQDYLPVYPNHNPAHPLIDRDRSEILGITFRRSSTRRPS